ncbi:hypothetical protein [Bradyrhizobium sp. BWA-3-5]|uniref:hypothetical protein n=1 Tax=Bradyrhizobium sp. BWA-3-5 TaxID=3080013 RepID=UPI00293EA43C|nr:hypothetical protein [Bradyrhizobium sp. BWA-3-5]WOH68667.1 hypothetical protein RX331_13565 [Bradyrhizobium sp. BWA-3-5]
MSEKIQLADGDEIIFKFENGKWKMHVKYKSGGTSGRLTPYNSLDEAVADLKQMLASG